MKVLALSASLTAIAALLLLQLRSPAVLPIAPFRVPWWAFAPAILAAEGLMLHIELRNQTHSFNLSEIPLVIGFFFAAPWAVVAGRLLGHLIYRLVVVRQSPLKIVFNLSSFAADSVAGLAVFHLVAGPHSPLSPISWAAVLVAVLAADAVSLTAVTTVIRWNGGGSEISSVVLTGAATAGINTGLAILAVVILWAAPWGFALFVLVVLAFSLLYRRHFALRHRYSSLQMLYGFTQAIGASIKAEEVTGALLGEACKLLRTAHAELVLLDDETGEPALRITGDVDGEPARERMPIPGLVDEPVWRHVVSARRPVSIPRTTRDPEALSCLARMGVSDCMLAPIVADDRVVGTIMVADRLTNISTFDQDDLQVFATVASHASVSLENGRLVERLQREAEERRHEARTDSLTGLPNRTMFVQRVADIAGAAAGRTSGPAGQRRDSASPAGVMLMDLDRFKQVNDTLGHHHGDLLLQEVAKRLVDALRVEDTVARLGGDEFAILLPRATSAAEVIDTAARLVAALDLPFSLEGISVEIGASVGVAMFPEHGRDATTLLQRADVAMYEAKDNDRSIALYSTERDENSVERLTMATELRSAMLNGEIEVYYQPKARLADGVVVGAEALMRWNHPTRGMIGPNVFIPVAEQTGLITPLTITVLRRALEQSQVWSELGHEIGVSVNLAVRSLLDTDLPGQIQELLTEMDVPAARLTLEITESSVMADPTRTIAVLHRLAALGVTLSVDDFGTGYSSLSYLRRLPVNEVKIDQSFVFRIGTDPKDAAIVRSVVELGHNLGLRIVAEGVEDRVSWDLLEKMGCDDAQGHYLTKPIPADSLTHWLVTTNADARPFAEAEVAAAAHPAGKAIPRVMIVDDDRTLRQVITGLLVDEGHYTISEAADGWEAIVLARQFQPDVILLDLTMPRMNGLTALPSIRAVAPRSRIVVLSASVDRTQIDAATEAGAVAVLDKAEGLALLHDQVVLALAS